MTRRSNISEGFEPKTICYQPQYDRLTPTRSEAELRLGAKTIGFVLERIPNGYMGATERDPYGFPRRVNVWDNDGRLIRTDFAGTVEVCDISGPGEGEQSPIFSNVYEYGPDGALASATQVVTQADGSTYVYRDWNVSGAVIQNPVVIPAD